MPASIIRRTGLSSIRSITLSAVFESGQTVSVRPRRAISATSSGSSMARLPWSMRSTRMSISASRTYPGGPSSPAWQQSRRPISRQRWKRRANFEGGCPFSELSRPTPTKRSSQGSAWRSVSNPSSSERWRRKLMISFQVMPWRRSPSSSPARMPLATTSNGTPRVVWPCGSKKISTWVTLSAAQRSR